MSTKPQNLPFSCLPRLYFLLSAIVALYLSRVLYKSTLFMQNKPNFDKGQNKPNPLYKRDLRKFYTLSDNEKQTQNKPNLLDAQMNVSSILTKDYENKRLCRRGENKPNSNPIKPNFKPHTTQTLSKNLPFFLIMAPWQVFLVG